ncbi:hypothetical protein [Amaricoccus sp. W119]
MDRFLLALLNTACALFRVDSRALTTRRDEPRMMGPESFGR